MTGQPAPEFAADRRTHLSTGQLVGLVLVLCVILGAGGAAAHDSGEYLGGAAGAWAGDLTVFVLVCVLSVFLVRRYANPNLLLMCSVFIGGGFGKVGDEIGKSLGEKFWPRALGFAAFVLGYVVATAVLSRVAAGRKAQPQPAHP